MKAFDWTLVTISIVLMAVGLVGLGELLNGWAKVSVEAAYAGAICYLGAIFIR